MTKATENRLTLIELRLNLIEQHLGIAAEPSKKAASPTPAPATRVAPSARSSIPAPSTTTSIDKPGNWLGIVAILCFVFAAGFIVKLSIESGWLTPLRQIGLATLLGGALIGCGFLVMKSDRDYASFLPGAGIIVLYLTSFATHRYYGLISFELAMACVSLVSALCIWLYTRIRHDIYAVVAATGAYLSPITLGLNTGAEFTLYYYLLCSLAFATISITVASRTLTVISAYLAIIMSAFIGDTLEQDILVSVMLALHFLVFSIGTYLYSYYQLSPLSERDAWKFLPVLLTFYAMEYHFLDRIQPGLAPWISLCFAGVLITLYLSARKYFPDNHGSRALVLAFTGLVCFHSIYLELLPDMLRPWLFVIIMAGIAFIPAHRSAQQLGSLSTVVILAALTILALEYIGMVFHLWVGDDPSWLFVSFASFASLWAVIVRQGDRVSEGQGYTLLVAAHLLAIVGFYRLTTDISSLAVSASWLLYAICIMTFAFAQKDEAMAKSALFVLAFAAAKALLYDASAAPTLVRIGCLLLTGISLYSCGFLMRKIAGWNIIARP